MAEYLVKFALVIATAAFLVGTPAVALKPAASGNSKQVQQLLSCRSLADTAQRLACFDRESAAMEGAIARKDLVFIDRERATATKKALFGFSVPSFGGLFGGDDDEVKQIEGVIASAKFTPHIGWKIRLVDKSVWTQTDDTQLGIAPKPGNKVIIRRGTLGAFRMSIDGQPGLKVQRIG